MREESGAAAAERPADAGASAAQVGREWPGGGSSYVFTTNAQLFVDISRRRRSKTLPRGVGGG